MQFFTMAVLRIIIGAYLLIIGKDLVFGTASTSEINLVFVVIALVFAVFALVAIVSGVRDVIRYIKERGGKKDG